MPLLEDHEEELSTLPPAQPQPTLASAQAQPPHPPHPLQFPPGYVIAPAVTPPGFPRFPPGFPPAVPGTTSTDPRAFTPVPVPAAAPGSDADSAFNAAAAQKAQSSGSANSRSAPRPAMVGRKGSIASSKGSVKIREPTISGPLPGTFATLTNEQISEAEELLSRCELVIRQQPDRARMIGFGEIDRRPIDPPPIIEIKLWSASGLARVSHTAAARVVAHASLLSESGAHERNLVLTPSQKGPIPASAWGHQGHGAVPVLVGNMVAECQVWTDLDGSESMFFTFPDISIRVSGKYRLRFVVVDIKNSRDMDISASAAGSDPLRQLGAQSPTQRAEIFSDVFTAYHPKNFPGLADSTPLSKHLAVQGARIHIRQDGHGKHRGTEEPPGETDGDGSLLDLLNA
ncbi:hypothetical protein HDU87_005754 [Geranomyces variabilis]|uniref:Velvet domain-containing protein n=1 Tax=Geranomyces variabilis TaxID=109894 RepID=A0AAD5XNT3_9FUNG|nr:hypothetical protein HDU87_005754 [Geranomyces variabilis]